MLPSSLVLRRRRQLGRHRPRRVGGRRAGRSQAPVGGDLAVEDACVLWRDDGREGRMEEVGARANEEKKKQCLSLPLPPHRAALRNASSTCACVRGGSSAAPGGRGMRDKGRSGRVGLSPATPKRRERAPGVERRSFTSLLRGRAPADRQKAKKENRETNEKCRPPRPRPAWTARPTSGRQWSGRPVRRRCVCRLCLCLFLVSMPAPRRESFA